LGTLEVDLSVCIINWNGKDILKKCLQSISKYDENLNIQIIVVDNASTDNSSLMVCSEFPEVMLIQNDRNIGFAKANNIAISKCLGRFVLLLNPDIIIKEYCFRQMIQFLEKNFDAGCIGCKLVNLDGSIQECFFQYFPTPFNEFLKEGLMFDKLLKKIFSKKPDDNSILEIEWIVGACMMFRREVIFFLNGFDEQFFMYSEDVDLCYRLRKLGYKIYYMGNLEMIHHRAALSKKKSKRYFSSILQKESRYKYMILYYGSIGATIYKLLWVISGLIRVSILSPAVIITFIAGLSSKDLMILALEKHFRIICWGIGFEKWTRYTIPN